MTLIAIGQFCARSNVRENAKICKNLILEASKNGAKAIFLPEASDFIAQGDDYKSLSEPVNKFSTFLKPLVEAANTCNIFVSVGLHESGASNDRCFNTQVLINNDGDILSKYRKVHLFNVLNLGPDNKSVLESRSTEHGNEFVKPTSTPFGNIGMLTCYDIRFPEASLWLRSQGSDIITYPSSFTVNTGKAHWETLLRARAIETQTYVIAAAQVGIHTNAGRASYGNSMIVNPWGEVIAQLKSYDYVEKFDDIPPSPSLAYADIDLNFLSNVRSNMPLWDQRVPNAYK